MFALPPLEPRPGPAPVMVRRVAIAQAALDRYRDRPFEWGKADCAHLAAYVAKAAGYKPGVARFGAYSSERGARRAMKRHGLSGLVDVVDSVEGLVRIAPAAALPGDLIAFPGLGEGWDALTVALGNGRVLGFHDQAAGHACVVIAADMAKARAAWSVAPCPR